jgi:hypothetical protein
MLPTKQTKRPPPGEGGNRRAEASTPRRAWARPAQRHPEGVLTHSKRLEKPFTPRRAERPPQAEASGEGHSHLAASDAACISGFRAFRAKVPGVAVPAASPKHAL